MKAILCFVFAIMSFRLLAVLAPAMAARSFFHFGIFLECPVLFLVFSLSPCKIVLREVRRGE